MIHLYEVLRIVKFVKTEKGVVVAKFGEREAWGLFNGESFSLGR